MKKFIIGIGAIVALVAVAFLGDASRDSGVDHSHHIASASVTQCDGGSFSGNTFTANFTGNPSTPQDCVPTGWDVQKHSRDDSTWVTPEPMVASHGPDCGGPPATHQLTSYDDMVFGCKDHLMTSIKAGGYGVIYLTPPALMDFSSGTATFSINMSTLRTSSRDWVDFWITPPADAMELPLEDWLPDLYGTPKNGIHVFMTGQGNDTVFKVERFDNYTVSEVAGNWWTGYGNFLTPDAARRDTLTITVSATHMTVGMPAYNFKWIDSDMPSLSWSTGVVQVGHHSYNPEKDCNVANAPGPDGTCKANTWHWDGVKITPAVPFTIVPVGVHLTAVNTDLTLPTGSGRVLHYAATGANLQLSFDSGATWVAGGLVPGSAQASHDAGSTSSYAAAVPDSATKVRFRADYAYGGAPTPTMFDPHVWRPVSAATPTPTPTATPTATPTPTPSPTPTATPTPTPSPTPTATPTPPAVVCRMAYYRDGVLTQGPIITCP